MNTNLTNILGIEPLCAAQGIEFRAPLKTSVPLASAIAVLQLKTPSLTVDRYLADDIAAAAQNWWSKVRSPMQRALSF